jgi:hypothetical protein
MRERIEAKAAANAGELAGTNELTAGSQRIPEYSSGVVACLDAAAVGFAAMARAIRDGGSGDVTMKANGAAAAMLLTGVPNTAVIATAILTLTPTPMGVQPLKVSAIQIVFTPNACPNGVDLAGGEHRS